MQTPPGTAGKHGGSLANAPEAAVDRPPSNPWMDHRQIARDAEPCLRLPWNHRRDWHDLRRHEWLVTNGLGGFASGSVLGIPTRRYHGYFIPNLAAPNGRTVLIPRLDDAVAGAGFGEIMLGGYQDKEGNLYSTGFEHLEEFRTEWGAPVWIYRFSGRALEKKVIMPHGQNTTLVVYRLLEGDPVTLGLRPFLSLRTNDGALMERPFRPPLRVTGRRFEIQLPHALPCLRMALRPQRGVFVCDEEVTSGVYYRVEEKRGYDHQEDVASPGRFSVDLQPGDEVALILGVEDWETLDLLGSQAVEAERRRLQGVLARAPEHLRSGAAAQLVLAADQFLILPATRLRENALARAEGAELRTVIAGYHWFTDWGRDTMISLEGLALCTGRVEEARAILRTFALYVQNGLIPNHFPEGERHALYNTADATLWYVHALDRYIEATSDRDTAAALFPILGEVVRRHVEGTDFGIGVDPRDGLLRAGAEGYQLTWMDAKVGDWVVTPRRGKPVELQALWYNALGVLADLARLLGESPAEFEKLAARTRTSFHERFWFEEGQHLHDVIDGDPEDLGVIRPNQIFALSLPRPILEERRWRPVFDAVERTLLTPYGLRTLDPAHRDYRPRYDGDLRSRDAAYHQGTVWPWLIGPFWDARRRVHPGTEAGAGDLTGSLEAHLHDAGVGSISEIFDGEPPFRPRGCIAQAWSVAELLRIHCLSHRKIEG